MGVLVERATGDVIPADDANFVKDYIEDAEETVNTLSLNIKGSEVISSTGYVKPVRIVNPDAGGTLIYASDGTTQIGELDDNGNLKIKGDIQTNEIF